MPLADLQQRFAAALADPAAAPPVTSSARRFAIHRNNVRSGIIGVLEVRYPVVKRLVGDDFFLGLSHAYLDAEPPTSPILMLYGSGLPAFIDNFDGTADVPYLADVARLEWLQHEAFNAADAIAIGSAALATIPAERVADVRFAVHPSLRLLASPHPALTIWQMNSGPGEVQPTRLAAEAEHVLIVRPALAVELRRIDAAIHAFCGALRDRRCLGDAVDIAISQPGTFDVHRTLAALFAMGALVGYGLSES